MKIAALLLIFFSLVVHAQTSHFGPSNDAFANCAVNLAEERTAWEDIDLNLVSVSSQRLNNCPAYILTESTDRDGDKNLDVASLYKMIPKDNQLKCLYLRFSAISGRGEPSYDRVSCVPLN